MAAKRFDPDEVLERAMRVFWAKGYEGASAQDLVDAMGIRRGSLYATFGSKRLLYLRALERYLERDRATLAAGLDAGEDLRGSLGKLLRGYADRLAADPDRKGCFFVNACAEVGAGDEVLGRRLREEVAAQTALLLEAVEAARRRGEVAASADADTLAAFLVGAIHGLRSVGKATGDRERLERMIAVTLDAVVPTPSQ